ncbi:unnamed protein product [Adineta steineri]|uniref:WAP domain-containing protein n=1 Tax=Adineta steineri TaxID=433720 RepID=A0A819F2F3_9BILA|nr:unnamed protein product [Adineta steineri]
MNTISALAALLFLLLIIGSIEAKPRQHRDTSDKDGACPSSNPMIRCGRFVCTTVSGCKSDYDCPGAQKCCHVELYPSTPIAFRGLWCINEWDNSQQNYSRQLGQAFFYNNETFTLNFLDNIQNTWINHFISINKTDNENTYQIFTDTSKGPLVYVNRTSCFWRRQISNNDIIWSQQSNGTCTQTFEIDNSSESIRYTRNALDCHYVDDENTNEILSNTPFENELLQFDQSLSNTKQNQIVFYGSSSIRFWSTLEKDFSHIPMDKINRGYGGSTLKQCWQQFKRIILPLEPRILILYAGENDIADEGETAINIQLNFREFISTIRRFFPLIPIAYISIKPSPSRFNKINEMNQTNHLIREDIQHMKNIHYIDIFNDLLTSNGTPRSELFISDNLHMNENGYAIWTRAVNNYLHMNGLISSSAIHCEISFFIFIFNLLAFFI